MEDFQTLCVVMFIIQLFLIGYFANITLKNREKNVLLSKRVKRLEYFMNRKDDRNENAQES